MKRILYIPKDAIPDIVKLISFNEDEIESFRNILIDKKNKTVLDMYIDIMNKMSVSDDDAASIFSVYKYILLILEERDLDFTKIIPEIKYILKTSSIQDCDKIIHNLNINSENFKNLFLARSTESEHAKRKFLSSELYNSVVDIHSICDIRPIFNEKRTKINEILDSVYLEFTVKDSLDNYKIIPLSLDVEALDDLISEIKKIKQKKAIIDKQFSRLGSELNE